MKNTKEAFKWIIGIMERHNVPFQITGGLAARVYGSDRSLADIDLDIPEIRFEDILPDVKNYVIFGPERFIDDNWDLMLMTLKFQGQEIDICSDRVKIRSARTGKWQENRANFSESEMHKIYGISVPVIKRKHLLAYKKMLDRQVDREDIKAMSNLHEIV